MTTVEQTITPLSPIGVVATRDHDKGPQGVPVNKSAKQADVLAAATSRQWRLRVTGRRPFTMDLEELEALANHEAHLPITCVEGWSVGARWRGVPLLSLVIRAGGSADSRVHLVSLERDSQYNNSHVEGPQVRAALLATDLNGDRLDIDHGYPIRLIAPNRPGVLNTKWLTSIEVD